MKPSHTPEQSAERQMVEPMTDTHTATAEMSAAALPVASWTLQSCPQPNSSVRQAVVSVVPFRIGRDSSNDLCVSDPTVSSRHAKLLFIGDTLFVKDEKSTNGTFVNGHRVLDVEGLRDGDLLQFGTAKFNVLENAELSAPSTVSADAAGHALAHFQFDKLIEQPAVVPFFQPIVDLADFRWVGFEVLGRSRLIGLETPANMFRVAAERSLESELSRVLRREGMQISSPIGTGVEYYLNTHPTELREPGLLESIEQLREENPDASLTLEIHEAAVTSSVYLGELRKHLRDLNIKLAYDDFGAGQARLLELSDVPPDVLKFDINLVQGLPNAPRERQQLIRSLIDIVNSLGVAALAEGVETREEAEICREVGFTLAQGYYFGRPAPASESMQRMASEGLGKTTE